MRVSSNESCLKRELAPIRVSSNESCLEKELAETIGLHPGKKTLLFSATWDGSGMSAIDRWHDRLDAISEKYNIIVTVHAWTSEAYVKSLEQNPNVHFIRDYDILRYVKLADVCISDTTSLIAEFCILDKPVITFRVQKTARTTDDVMKMIEAVSERIDAFEELAPAVEKALANPDERMAQRTKVVRTMVNPLDGKAGLRAAQEMSKLIPDVELLT